VQIRSFVFGEDDDSPFKSLKELKMEYLEKRKQSFEKIFKYLPQARESESSKVQLQSVRDPESNILKLVVTSGKKASEIKIYLDQVSLLDKISFHKQSSDILYAELLQLAINHSKALTKIDKLELRLKQEKTASKSHQKHIKSLESDLVTEVSDQKDAKALQKLLDNKDKLINELKEKLKIPPTQVLQTLELAEVEFEKENLHQRVLFLHNRVNNLTQENKVLSEKLNQSPTLDNPLVVMSGENIELSTEDIIATMYQVQLKEI